MKKFLTLTLVLFLSLFIVGESGAERPPYDERILSKGEIIASGYSVTDDIIGETRRFDLLVRYKGYVYWCTGDTSISQSNIPFFCGDVFSRGP